MVNMDLPQPTFRSTRPAAAVAEFQPRLRPSFQLAAFVDRFGCPYWILRNPDGTSYLNLNSLEMFLVERMDGRASVAELTVAFLRVHRALGDQLLHALLLKLSANHFLEQPPPGLVEPAGAAAHWWSALWRSRIPLRDVDSLATRLYRWAGWIVMTRQFLLCSLLANGVGIGLFVFQVAHGSDRYLHLETFSGTEIAEVWLTLPLWMVLHEGAHAVACKALGLEVGEAGVILGVGTLAPYVNTNAAWMAPPRQRMMVSLAGPYTNLTMAGLGSIASFVLSAHPFWLRIAAYNYLLVLINANPWIESDGYLMLMDYMRIPGLRMRARRSMRGVLARWLKRDWRGLSALESLYARYWIGGLIYSVVMTPLVTWVVVMSLYRIIVSVIA